MNHQRTSRLNPLLDTVPPGFMVDTPWLRAQGIDSKSIHDYVARGWLERVVRGVYRRPLPEGAQGDREESWAIPLLSLQWLMKYAVHLGGESALDRDIGGSGQQDAVEGQGRKVVERGVEQGVHSRWNGDRTCSCHNTDPTAGLCV